MHGSAVRYVVDTPSGNGVASMVGMVTGMGMWATVSLSNLYLLGNNLGGMEERCKVALGRDALRGEVGKGKDASQLPCMYICVAHHSWRSGGGKGMDV